MRALVLAVLVALAAGPAHAQSGEEPYGRGSYWGSGKAEAGNEYRWRLLGIGVGLLGITGLVMLRLVRKANAERAARK